MYTARTRRRPPGQHEHPHENVETDTGGIPEKLTEQLEQLACRLCGEMISRWEMAAIWPEGGYVAHLPCWAQQPPGVSANQEASS